jgi:rod shape-determining protein MreC
LATTLLGGSVCLLQFDRRDAAPGPIGHFLSTSVAPLHRAVSGAGQVVRGVWLDYVALTEVREKNLLLASELRALQAEAAQTADLRAENQRLRRLLDLGDRRKDLRLRAARVVTRTTSAYFRVMRIDLAVGDEEDIEQGMPVVAPGGVVGQVRAHDGDRAEVLLVTDPRSAIDVVLEQSRARGVAVGTGEPDKYAAKLRYLQRDVRAIEGERVLTTGDDGRYPRGLVVGKVRNLSADESGPFQRADVVPLVDLNALEEVFIVLGPSGLNADDVLAEEEGVK